MSGPDLPPEPPPFDPGDWFRSGDEAAEAAALSAAADPVRAALAQAMERVAAGTAKIRAEEEEADAGVWPLSRLVSVELAEAPPPRRWLLRQSTGDEADPLFPLGKVGILSAAGGTGKSMALCGLALAVATGRPWLQAGRGAQGPAGFGVVTPGRVALLLAEEDREEVIRRLYQAARLMGLSAAERGAAVDRLWIGALAGEPVELVERDNDGNVNETPRARGLRARLAAEAEADLRQRAEGVAEHLAAEAGPDGWALVIVDPLSRFGGVDTETDNGAATRAIQALEALTKLPGGPAVMVAHHERKGSAKDESAGQDAVRGSSAIVDGARWVARLVPVMVGGERWKAPDGSRAVSFLLVKTNYTPPLSERARLLVLDSGHHGALRVATKAEAAELETAQDEAKEDAARAKAAAAAKKAKAKDQKAGSWAPPRPEGV